MVDWVNTVPTLDVASNFTLTDKDFETFTNASNSGFTATNSDRGGRGGFGGVMGSDGDIVSVSFDLNIVSGSPSLILTTFNTNGTSSNTETYSSSGSYTATLTATSLFDSIVFNDGDIPAEWTVANLIITSIQSSGHVTKWYDQSGNDNHAVQATPASQPKVVEGGVLVTDGLKFDGVDDTFTINPIDTSGTPLSCFALQKDATNALLGTENNRSLVFNASNAQLFAGAGPIIESFTDTSGGKHLHSCIHDGTTGVPNVSFFKDGVIGTQSSVNQGDAGVLNPFIAIGARAVLYTPSTHLNGTISEIIIYDSDQTDNRKAIESNMADHYGNIDLPAGFDSGNDEVDGYVATWYDQSGNGNNAAQAVATSQPKIVEGGVLQKDDNNNPELKFDGGQSLVKTTFTQGQLSQPNTAFAVSKILGANAYVFDSSDGAARNLIYTDASYYRFFAGTDQAIAAHDTDQHLFTALFNTTNSDAYLDGVIEASSVDVGTHSMSGITIGARNNLASQLNGTISEIIIYDSDQSLVRKSIEFNINNAYSIY
jgi:hypothetical protein